MALKQQDRFEAAEAELRKATALDPRLPEAHFTLGVVLWQTGRTAEAVPSFQAAIAARADYAEAHYMLGTVLRQQGRTDEGVAEFREAIRRRPDLAEAHLSLGQALQQKGDLAAAAASLAEADRLNKKKGDAQRAAFALNAGMARLGKGDVPGAIERLREAVQLAPDEPRARLQLARALKRQGSRREAEEQLAEARRLAPYLESPWD
jgi:tetratricopeptide (TPR) repeat protein